MSEAKGKLKTCDRCGKSIFLKYIGQGVLDGGFTRFDKYEELPETWLWTSQIGTLCDECSGIFRSFIRVLMGNRSVAPAWQLKPGDEKYLEFVTINEEEDVNNA